METQPALPPSAMNQGVHRLVLSQSIWILLIIQTVSGQKNITQCYGDLGCFPNDYPWTSKERPFPPPQDPQTVGTKFYCYTRESTMRYNITLRPNIDLNGCQFKASRTTIFLNHGFASNGNDTWLDTLKNVILLKVDVNVIIVDWGTGSGGSNFNYPQAASNTRVVAMEIVRFLKYLSRFGLTGDQLHLIGFSLGAHLFSYISKSFGPVANITGLDPAGPGYNDADEEVRLDEGDATFVVVVHTSAYPFIPFLGFGYIKPCGLVDFYMNGGRSQPGCPLPSNLPEVTSINDLPNIAPEVFKQSVFCSHARSFMYFIYAIEGSCTFVGHKTTFEQIQSSGIQNPIYSRQCTPDTCTVLLLNTPMYPKGVINGNTTSSPPFCQSRVGFSLLFF